MNEYLAAIAAQNPVTPPQFLVKLNNTSNPTIKKHIKYPQVPDLFLNWASNQTDRKIVLAILREKLGILKM
jgi:hypothetical protein